MSQFVTVIKGSFTWQAGFAARHPWLSVGAIWTLAVLAIAF